MIIENYDAAKTWLEEYSPYFKIHELQCKCGCGTIKIDTEAVKGLNQLRGYLGIPLIINSGYRCPEHNERPTNKKNERGIYGAGGVKSSQHTKGKAFDVTTSGFNPSVKADIICTAKQIGAKGLGIGYTSFVHVDWREGHKVVFEKG